MGNECKVCRKRNPEEELILNPPIQKNDESETLENSQFQQKYQTFKEIINSNPEHYKKLHKIKNALLSFQKRQIIIISHAHSLLQAGLLLMEELQVEHLESSIRNTLTQHLFQRHSMR